MSDQVNYVWVVEVNDNGRWLIAVNWLAGDAPETYMTRETARREARYIRNNNCKKVRVRRYVSDGVKQ